MSDRLIRCHLKSACGGTQEMWLPKSQVYCLRMVEIPIRSTDPITCFLDSEDPSDLLEPIQRRIYQFVRFERHGKIPGWEEAYFEEMVPKPDRRYEKLLAKNQKLARELEKLR